MSLTQPTHTSHRAAPAVVLMLMFVVTACGQGQPNATGPGASGSHPPDPIIAEILAAELSLRQEIRTQAGLVNIGPGAVELAGLMDKSESVALNALKADTYASTAQATGAVLVDAPTPGESISGPVTIVTTGFTDAMISGATNTRTLDDHGLPAGCVPGYGTCSGDPGPPPTSGSKTETTHGCSTGTCEGPAIENVTVGGYPGQISSQTTLTAGYDGSSISMDIKIEIFGNITDPTTHATIYRIESTGTGHISGDACPDASGTSRLHIEFSAKENYFIAADPAGGRAGYGLEQSYSGDVVVHVDDNANLAGIDIGVKAHAESKGGGRGAGDSQSELKTFSNDATGSQTFGYDPTSGFTGGSDTVKATSKEGLFLLLSGLKLYTELPAKAAAKATEKAWQSGMCIVVHADPNGGSVDKNSVTNVRVTVKQRYEGTELDKPVEASFSGVTSLDPVGKKQPAPAAFLYTAGSKKGDTGSATFKSVSNRGIGHTGVTFTVSEVPPTPTPAASTSGSGAPHAFVGSITMSEVTSIGLTRTMEATGLRFELSQTFTNGPGAFISDYLAVSGSVHYRDEMTGGSGNCTTTTDATASIPGNLWADSGVFRLDALVPAAPTYSGFMDVLGHGTTVTVGGDEGCANVYAFDDLPIRFLSFSWDDDLPVTFDGTTWVLAGSDKGYTWRFTSSP